MCTSNIVQGKDVAERGIRHSIRIQLCLVKNYFKSWLLAYAKCWY